jgi:hypothetical protein
LTTLNGGIAVTGTSTLNGNVEITDSSTLTVGGLTTLNGNVDFNNPVNVNTDLTFNIVPTIYRETEERLPFAPTVYNTFVYSPSVPIDITTSDTVTVLTTSITTDILGGVMLQGFLNVSSTYSGIGVSFAATIGEEGDPIYMGTAGGSLNYNYPLVASLENVPAGTIPIIVSITLLVPPVPVPTVSVTFGVLNVLGNLVKSP